MQKRFLRYLLLISLLTLVVSAVATTSLYYITFVNQAKADLSQITHTTAQVLNHVDNDTAYLHTVTQDSLNYRISLINPQGDVVFDSAKNIHSLNSHKDRPEFIGALEHNSTSVERFSHTLAKDLYYVSQKLDNGYVLRISREMDSLIGTFIGTIPIDIAISITIFIIALLVSMRLATTMFAPLNNHHEDLTHIDTDSFPEIKPFITRIKNQNELIKTNLLNISRERDTMNTILKNMKEALIIVDNDLHILSINNAALKMFNVTPEQASQDLTKLVSNKALLALTQGSLHGTSTETVFSLHSKSYKTYINPVFEENSIKGVVMLFIDETEEIQAKHLREEFSSNVSHELKTPLTSICGFSELLACGMVEESSKNEFYQLIYKDSKRLLNLVEDIMKISGLEQEQISGKEPIMLREIIDDIIQAHETLITSKHIHISVSGNGEIYENKTMIWELFSNLISNALKYNKNNGSLEITITTQPETYEIIIKDTGIGIANDDINRIFERFYRADKSRSQTIEGTGLGLSIVKHIIQTIHGSLDVTSQINKGTAFTLALNKPHARYQTSTELAQHDS